MPLSQSLCRRVPPGPTLGAPIHGRRAILVGLNKTSCSSVAQSGRQIGVPTEAYPATAAQVKSSTRWRCVGGLCLNRVVRLAVWLLFVCLCPVALPATNPAVKVALQVKRTWDFSQAHVHFSNEFPGARLNACEQIGAASFRAIISPENTRINESAWYAFKVWSDHPAAITVCLTNTHLAYLRRPWLSGDGVTWNRLPDDACRFDRKTRTVWVRLHLGPRPLWLAAVRMLGVEELEKWMQRISDLPFVRSRVVGRSIEARPLRELVLGNTNTDNYVFVVGRQHPPEVNGSIGLMSFVDTLAGDSSLARTYRQQFQTVVLPLLNPDGIEHGHWRSNLGAVDLNRDWGPFTQPETVAARDALTSIAAQPGSRPFLFLDFHATHTNVFYEQVSSRPVYPDRFTDRWLAGIHQQCPEFHFLRSTTNSAGLPTSKAWASARLHVPALTCEFGYGTASELVQRAARVEAEEMMRLLLAELPVPKRESDPGSRP
jgi:cytosolic carboxypeptidase protein 6